MNDVINWVALNNTLMIRVGFSAVILLIIAYTFRYFFVPKISVVTQAEEAAAAEESLSIKTDDSLNRETILAEERVRAEEIETLKAEVTALKTQLQEAPVGTAAAAPSVSTAPAPIEKELTLKIETLEARLAEYEIIAEEIADVGRLRFENEQLKKKIGSGFTTDEAIVTNEAPATPEAEVEPEIQVEAETPVIEAGADDYSTTDFSNNEPESQLVITSEDEVSEDEQALINDFEDMIRKRG